MYGRLTPQYGDDWMNCSRAYEWSARAEGGNPTRYDAPSGRPSTESCVGFHEQKYQRIQDKHDDNS
jgi:hypothetical protein